MIKARAQGRLSRAGSEDRGGEYLQDARKMGRIQRGCAKKNVFQDRVPLKCPRIAI